MNRVIKRFYCTSTLRLSYGAPFVSSFVKNCPLIKKFDCRWVRSWRCDCLVTWFCYQLIAKPSNKTATLPWADSFLFLPFLHGQQLFLSRGEGLLRRAGSHGVPALLVHPHLIIVRTQLRVAHGVTTHRRDGAGVAGETTHLARPARGCQVGCGETNWCCSFRNNIQWETIIVSFLLEALGAKTLKGCAWLWISLAGN